MKIKFFLLLFLLTACTLYAQNNSRLIFQKLKWCKLPQVEDSVLCGTYPVIENRQTNKGRIINLNIIVVPATHPDSLLAPVFDIDGGPGISDTKNVSFYADHLNPYRRYHDIVLVDVRGTGKSNSLYCPSLQNKKTLSEQLEDMYPPQEVKECYDELSKYADLTQYTTTNVVKDFEDVRKWLGYKKIEIFSLSYGTRAALVYMKMFPSSLEGCVLMSPIATYGKMPLYHARFAQDALNKFFADCNSNTACKEAFPNFEGEFETLMEKGKHDPFKVAYKDSTGKTEQLTITWNVFETKIRSLMYTPAGFATIPYLIHQSYLENFYPFLSLYNNNDMSPVLAEGDYLSVTCTEDVPFIDDDKIDSLTKGTFMGTYRIDQQKTACAIWAKGSVPKNFLDTIHSDVPVLIFSGGMDPITPTLQAKEIASHLPNSKFIFIPAMSHLYDGLSHAECFDNIAVSFFNHPLSEVDSNCVKDMLPPPYQIK
jgi:pimeloyl-ACP methyl ester carboxylesterase